MKEAYDIPMVGSVFTRNWSDPLIDDRYPRLHVEGSCVRQRFAVQLCDDGLESLDIHDGDWVSFRSFFRQHPQNSSPQVSCTQSASLRRMTPTS